MIKKHISMVVIALGLLVGCQSTPSQERRDHDDVTRMERVKNYDGLIEHYKAKLEQRADDSIVEEKLAQAYFKKGDIESASFYVQHLKKKGIDTPSLHQLEGQVFDANDDTENAISAYLASIQKGNNSAYIYILLGVSYAKIGQYDAAYEAMGNARLRGYDDLAVKNNIAMIHIANSEYDKAIKILVPVLKDHPSNLVVKSNLAIALIKNNQTEMAKQLLENDFSSRELNEIATELTQLREGHE
ncbi:tetratricopeptide repeat protein [Vibrio caribbeanicus]|uniref:tetratricopeptide repeat protein n=1 Tax=Vibrio caribbeanicus TaxID=701175 RepID=UPI0030DA538C